MMLIVMSLLIKALMTVYEIIFKELYILLRSEYGFDFCKTFSAANLGISLAGFLITFLSVAILISLSLACLLQLLQCLFLSIRKIEIGKHINTFSVSFFITNLFATFCSLCTLFNRTCS